MPRAVRLFLDNSNDLADKLIGSDGSVIDNISMVLGTDADHVIQISYKLFGSGTLSSFIVSPIGVMFSRVADRMLRNADMLPNVSTVRFV